MIESNAATSLELRHICHATFDELSEAGCSIQSYDDGAMPLQIDESMFSNCVKEPEKFLGSAEYRSINDFERNETAAEAIFMVRRAPSGAFPRLFGSVSVPIPEIRADSAIMPPIPA